MGFFAFARVGRGGDEGLCGSEQSVLILHGNNAGTTLSRHLPKLDFSRDIPVPGIVKQIWYAC